MSMKSVISLGARDQFQIPRPFGDMHGLEEGSCTLLVTPGYRDADTGFDRKKQFPHALIVTGGAMMQVERLLAQYVPRGRSLAQRIDDILATSLVASVEGREVIIPEPIAGKMRERSTRVTAILMPDTGIDLQFTSKRHPGMHPNLWMAMREMRDEVSL